MKKYELHVQLTPKVHNGEMQNYWQIVLVTEEGSYTIQDGWAKNYHFAQVNAVKSAKALGLV